MKIAITPYNIIKCDKIETIHENSMSFEIGTKENLDGTYLIKTINIVTEKPDDIEITELIVDAGSKLKHVNVKSKSDSRFMVIYEVSIFYPNSFAFNKVETIVYEYLGREENEIGIELHV